MPFCRKCQPGQFQPLFDQIKCSNCPQNNISPRGATSFADCYPQQKHPCIANPSVCGPHGICQQENGSPYLYSCLCEDEFIGEHQFIPTSKLVHIPKSFQDLTASNCWMVVRPVHAKMAADVCTSTALPPNANVLMASEGSSVSSVWIDAQRICAKMEEFVLK